MARAAGIVRPRSGTVVRYAVATLATLTWTGCSEDTRSPVGPTPTTVASAAAERGAGSLAARSGLVESGRPPQVTVQVERGFDPSATPNAGFVGGAAPTEALAIVLNSGIDSPVLPGPGWNGAVPVRPSKGPDGGSAPGVTASGAWEDASPETSIATVSHDAAAGGDEDAARLKASPPKPDSPVGGVEITDVTPVLKVMNADPDQEFLKRFAEENFQYEFAIYRVVGGSRTTVEVSSHVPSGSGSPSGSGFTSYRVTDRLHRAASYEWRARAYAASEDPSDPSFEGAYGPWSEHASFTTAAVVLGPPGPRMPIGGAMADIDTVFKVRNPTVEGSVSGNVHIKLQVASDDAFSNVVATGQGVVAADGKETDVPVKPILEPSTTYHWRARATASGAAGDRRTESDWSSTETFRTRAVTIDAPTLREPIKGKVGVGTDFRVGNGSVRGISEIADADIVVEVQVALSRNFDNPMRGRTQVQGGADETIVDLPDDLMPKQNYHWRAHAKVSVGESFSSKWSKWSKEASFETTSETTSGGTFGPPGNPPNMLHIVREVASQHPDKLSNSCQDHGGSWRFMELAVERLRQETGRWGYNCKRGNCADVSHDAIAYYRGSGTTVDSAQRSTDVAIIDIIAGHCGSNPQPAWGDVTQATADAGSIGRWKYPR